jgi:hypothetical protein
LIHWILTRMEENPNTVFYRKELESLFVSDFQKALDNNLLRRIETDSDSYSHNLDTVYRVINDKYGYEAINEDDSEADPVPLSDGDLDRYRLDLVSLAKVIQKENGLVGTPHSLKERLFFLGESEQEGRLLAYVLVLVNGSPLMSSVVVEAPAILSLRYYAIIAVYPNSLPDTVEQRRLQNLKIWCIPLPRDTFVLQSFRIMTQESEAFSLSESVVTWRGNTYLLKRGQYAVLNILWEASKLGYPTLNWKQIKDRLTNYNLYPARMRDYFKDSPLWNTLITRPRKSVYGLKI